MLSLFLRGKECHISIAGFSKVCALSETREVADNFVWFLAETIKNAGSPLVKKVVFAAGPSSFTSVRVVNSVVKGLYIADRNIRFLGVSTFLPYLYLVSKISKSGVVAIPTMRGDFFTARFKDGALLDSTIETIQELDAGNIDIYYDNNEIFEKVNLATIQVELLGSEIARKNKLFISSSLNPFYGYCPKFKF